jgi:Predicted xylanase/chitin deacetylase
MVTKAASASWEYLTGIGRLLRHPDTPPPIFHGPRDRPRVALTFDDGPDIATAELLALLGRHGARATFFVLGHKVGAREEVLRRALSEGHEVGNHSWNHHPRGRALPDLAQLACTNAAIRNATGRRPALFRAPYGQVSRGLSQAASSAGLLTIGWDVDAMDWSDPGSDEIVSRVLTTAQPGSILLLHDGEPVGCRPLLAALEQLLPELHRRGHELVTVSELLGLDSAAATEAAA